MRKILFAAFIVLLQFISCQKEKISFSENASEVFYVENAGAAMRVLVEGNTLSNTYILIIHGGPGASSYVYNTTYISTNLEKNCAVVYWDQRNSGASQGNNNGGNLHLSQMVDDLRKVIQVLKSRYGNDISLFLLGHSFGGLISADFVTSDDDQFLIKGLINVDGSHNYPLNDTLTRQKLLSTGQYEVSQNRNIDKWQPIINYCLAHQGNFSFEESQQLEAYATEAENYIDSIRHVNFVSEVLNYSISDKYPLTAMLSNLLYSEDSNFNKELAVTQFSSVLKKIQIPVLLLWGQYDFTCPPALGLDYYNRISSTDKKMAISYISGHNMFLQDEKFFCDEVNAFILTHR
jgi:pimeloyl-ACP methyl ester carboxylesterase